MVANNNQDYPAYLGLGLLALVVVGLVWQRHGWRRGGWRRGWLAILGTSVICALLASGRYAFLYLGFRVLPVVGNLRAPSRFLAIVVFALAVGGALLAHRLLGRSRGAPWTGRWRIVAALTLAGAVLAMLSGLLALPGFTFRGVQVVMNGPGHLLIGPLLVLAVYGLLWARGRYPGARLPVTFLLLLCLADVAAWTIPYITRLPKTTLENVAAARRQMAAPKPFRLAAQGDFNVPVWEGYRMATGYSALPPREPMTWFGEAAAPLKTAHRRLASIELIREGTNWVRVPDPLPRVRLVPELRHDADPLRGIAGLDAGDVALARPGVGEPFTGPPIGPDESVSIVSDTGAGIVMTALVAHRRLLVLSDRWDPGWTAAVDGEGVPYLPLFGEAVGGVVLEPGAHTIRLAYRPPGLAVTWPFAILGALGIAALLGGGVVRREAGVRG